MSEIHCFYTMVWSTLEGKVEELKFGVVDQKEYNIFAVSTIDQTIKEFPDLYQINYPELVVSPEQNLINKKSLLHDIANAAKVNGHILSLECPGPSKKILYLAVDSKCYYISYDDSFAQAPGIKRWLKDITAHISDASIDFNYRH